MQSVKIQSDVSEKYFSPLLATFFRSDIFLPGLSFDVEEGGDIFLRNVGLLAVGLYGIIPEKIVQHHRCQNLKS
jgi:hypothetical protein